jgi:hypothetical protein
MNPFRLRPPKDESVIVELQPAAPSNGSESALMIEYWAQQQNRLAQHESGRYQFSSILIAGSLAAIGLIAGGTLTGPGKWASCLAVVAVNILALALVMTELRWIKIHQSRAKAILNVMSPEIVAMQKLANAQWYARENSDDNHFRFTATTAIQALHASIAIVSLLMAIFLPSAAGS